MSNGQEHLQVQVLLAEYERVREDSRGFWFVIPALISVAVALLGGIVVLSLQSCPDPPAVECARVSPWLWTVTPAGPVIIAALIVQQVAVATARSNFEKALEREIFSRQRLVIPPPRGLDTENLPGLPVPSYSHTMNGLFDLRRAPWQFRALIGVFWLLALGLFVGSVGIAYVEIGADTFARLVLVCTYAICAGVLAWAAISSVHEKWLWRHLVTTAGQHLGIEKPSI